ncbi:PAS domain S-box protein [Paracoccus shandongensis]|uniref:PAS domain S-box protein n=1 Tax=Paracoccus shandongensis TaxID=2816048 RepID=UPI001A8D2617|nr:PAS domain S-box protein [Paracoccus shandongensis]
MTLRDPGPSWPPGKGDMARLVRRYRWSATPLGSVGTWPERLRIAVEMMLADPRPAALAVGPGRTFLFNDAAAQLYGPRAADLLGLSLPQAFPSYPAVADLYDRAFAGEPGEARAMPLAVTGDGGEVFDATLVPVGDGAGGVLAVLASFVEVGARLRAEAALRENEARLRNVLDGMDEAFGLMDHDFRILAQNAEALRLDGRPLARIVGRTHWEVYPGTEETELGRFLKRAMADRVPVTLEHRYGWPGGGETWLEMRAYPVPEGLAVFWRDISARKAAEARLRASEARYRRLFESIDEGFVIADLIRDAAGRPVDALYLEGNPAALRLTGAPGFDRRLRSEALPGGEACWLEIYDRVLRTGMAERLEYHVAPLGRWYDVQVLPMADADEAPRDGAPKAPGRVAILFQDVTARREAERVLRESEARHRLLIESLTQVVWETDAAGVVVADSPSWRAYTGQTPEEWLGHGWLDAVHPDDRPHAERQWREAVAARGLVNAEFRLRAPGGGWRWTNVRAAPMMDAGGHIGKWLGLNIDIDDRKRAEAALRESEARYRSLFNAVSQGLAINQLVRDGTGRVIDARYLDLNPAYEAQTGFDRAKAIGRLASEIFPAIEPFWLEMAERVVKTGRPERIERFVADTGRWFSFDMAPFEGTDQFVVLYDNITARKQAEAVLRDSEARQAFLLRFSDALRAEPDMDAVANRAIGMLADHMGLDRCYITVYRPDDDEAVFPYQVGNDSVPPLPARVRLSDFPEAYDQVRHGTFVVADDFERRGLSEAERANSGALGMRAMLASTLRRGEKSPLASLMAVSSRPRRWTPGEVALVEEAAERTWAAMEQARAEAALRASEARYRTLFETMDEGFVVNELIRDEEGRAVDLRYLELNPAVERLVGWNAKDTVGRRMSEMISAEETKVWVDDFEAVLASGTPKESEHYHPTLGMWFRANATPVGPDRVALVYQNTTAQKRAEQALRESEARQAFLLRLSDALRPLADPARIQAAATTLLREELDAGWCYYVEWNEAGTMARVLRDATREGLPSLAGEHDVSDVPEFLDLLRTGEILDAPDYAGFELLSPRIRGRYTALGFRSMLGVPLVKDGRLVATLLVGDTAIRSWPDKAVALARETAERTWAAVERARAEAALRERDEHNAFMVRFSDAVRELVDPQAVAQAACRLVAETLGVERAYWAEIDQATRDYVIGASVHVPGVPVIAGRFPVDAWEPLSSLHRAGLPVVVGDTQADPRLPPEVKAGYVQLSIGADLAVPVLLGGDCAARWPSTSTRRATGRQGTWRLPRASPSAAGRRWSAPAPRPPCAKARSGCGPSARRRRTCCGSGTRTRCNGPISALPSKTSTA